MKNKKIQLMLLMAVVLLVGIVMTNKVASAATKQSCAQIGGVCMLGSNCLTTAVPANYTSGSDCVDNGTNVCCIRLNPSTGTTNPASTNTNTKNNAGTNTGTNAGANTGTNANSGAGANTNTNTGAGANTNTGNGTNFSNPLRFSNVEGFLGGIMSAIQKIIVVLALVFIMIGAVMILVSAGNSGMVEQGKAAITMALVGLALGVAAPSLLKELSVIIGWGPGAAGPGLTLSAIAVNVLNFLLGTMGIVALVMLVIGAIMYLTSAGDEDRIDKGKEIFKYSLIGVIMAMASMVLVTQIAKFFQ